MTADYAVSRQQVQQEIGRALAAAGDTERAVRVVAVTKTVGPEEIPAILKAGLTDLGENRWQHAREMLASPAAGGAVWHFIGRLQSNKVRYVVPRFSYIHSIDSVNLGLLVDEVAARTGVRPRALLQVNVSGEVSKGGIRPDDVLEVCRRLQSCPHLHLCGLMTMAPAGADEATLRAVFGGLRVLRDEVRDTLGIEDFRELSMGMSDDFPIAVEEGATMVRIGRRLVG
ncbi:MAG: YggS family pyridoxal phosphate-dependent enzyme [Alicyclobacillus sp.]|nr:YggS family pyridoxal phosphate-dependent enzyme [Alicyclobacillus sp.]